MSNNRYKKVQIAWKSGLPEKSFVKILMKNKSKSLRLKKKGNS